MGYTGIANLQSREDTVNISERSNRSFRFAYTIEVFIFLEKIVSRSSPMLLDTYCIIIHLLLR